MHPIQQKILNLAREYDISRMSLRQIGGLIDETHPQKIKHHINQLEEAGLLDSGPRKWEIRTGKLVTASDSKKHVLLSIPVFGLADCGPAGVVAEENLQGFLKVSNRFLPKKKGLFAVQTQGLSMDRARIGLQKRNIEPGDYAIIDNEDRSPDNGDYVLSIIDGVANIKRFYLDKRNKQIALIPESSKNFTPIYVHPEDEGYMVNGKVVQIIKNPKTNQ